MKKFIDQSWLEEPWFDALKPQQKLAWFYLWAKCDLVGVWSGNRKIADMQIGYEIKWDDLSKALGEKVKILPSGKWWLTEYCPFQFGNFSSESRVHLAAKRELNKHGIEDSDSLWIAYLEATGSLKNKNKNKNKEKKKGSTEGKHKDTPDSSEQVLAYCSELGLQTEDGQWFYDRGLASGWCNDGKPIKDWRATVRTWRTMRYFPSLKTNGHTPDKKDALKGYTVHT